MTTTIEVRTNPGYPVLVGNDMLTELPKLIDPAAMRVAIIHPPAMDDHAASLRAMLADLQLTAITLQTPDAEAAKTADVAAFCWDVLGQSGFTRSDVIVSLGGGATTDLAGFVAATWLRGVKVVHIPTTLLAMVDAAVGGKTGINTASGKNLVGAIHEPSGVICDLDLLATLPVADLRAGLAEVIKAGFIRDGRILEVANTQPTALADPGSAALREVVERAIKVKADVVAGDLHETSRALGGREILNYGHTFGHAIEKAEKYRWRHGEAVSVGMVFAAELARLAGRLDDEAVATHREILAAVGLPVTYQGADWATLHQAMSVDKKARGAQLRFVILERMGAPVFLDGPDPTLLVAAFGEVSPGWD